MADEYAMQVQAHHKLMYATSVQQVTQQTKNPLASAVTEVSATGEAQSAADLLDKGEYQYGEDRSRRNPELPAIGSRRWLVRPPVIESGQYIDQEDKFGTAFDPTSNFVRNHTLRVIRGKADRILGIRKIDGVFQVADGGILGTSIEGKRPGTSGTALPASQIIPHGSTGLTIDKLRNAKLILNKADFGLEDDDPLYCVITPEQTDDLLAIAQASSTPLNAFNIEQLRTGVPTSLMGITWIVTNRLAVNAGGQRLCPIFSKKNILAGIWQDVKGDAWNDTSAKNKPYVYVSAYIDAVRAEDGGVIVMECAE